MSMLIRVGTLGMDPLLVELNSGNRVQIIEQILNLHVTLLMEVGLMDVRYLLLKLMELPSQILIIMTAISMA